MTIDQAIYILRNTAWLGSNDERDETEQAVEMVIDKLLSAEKAQLSGEDATKDATSDLIRRKDAIDAVEFGITYAKAIDVNTGESKELFKKGNDALKKAVERLKELPSAEPKTPSSGSITCVKSEKMHDRTMGDLISRQAAIDAIHEDADWLASQGSDWQVERMERDKSILKSLPSAEPEIIRCRDCKHHDGIRCFRWNSTIITGFDDYCSNAERRGEEE